MTKVTVEVVGLGLRPRLALCQALGPLFNFPALIFTFLFKPVQWFSARDDSVPQGMFVPGQRHFGCPARRGDCYQHLEGIGQGSGKAS